MREQHNSTTTVEERQKQIGLWAAGIFTILSIAFAGISMYAVFAKQQGRFYLEDAVLMPSTIIAVVLSILSYFLIRRGRHQAGIELLFSVMMGLPVVAILLIDNFVAICILYIVVFASVMYNWVLPKASRRRAISIIAVAVLAMVGIEIWSPGFRGTSTFAASVLPAVIVLAAVVLVGFLVRQAWDTIIYSVSNRLTALVLVVTLPLLIGITAYISTRAGNEIEAQALQHLKEGNESLSGNVSTWLEMHARSIHEMALLPDIKSMSAFRQKPALLAIAKSHPNLFLVHTTDLNGINIARNDDAELNDYHDRAWFLGAKSGAPITFEALISRTISKPALNMSTPIYNESGKIVGVASIVSELSEISREVLTEEGGGITYIIDAKNRVVAHPDPTYTEKELRDLSAYPPVAALNEGKTGQLTFTDENGVVWAAYVDRLDNGWGIVAQQPEAELLAPVRQFQTVAGILIVIGSVIMFALAWFAIRRSLQPIGSLTTTVSAIAAGDLSRVAEVKTKDEIGVLAATFNEMTAKLRESFSTLERRVADRTRNLELAAEVGRTVSQVRALDVMLTDAAELIRAQFDLYYVQVYLTDPNQSYLNLQAGTGQVGKQLLEHSHRLPLDTGSINGRAAIEKKSVVISDTTQNPAFKPNPLLPDTHSEMAVPLLSGERVVGVLDMQSEHGGSLNTDILPAFEALAGQLAIAIQNANLLAEANQARAEVEAQARRQTRANWAEYLDAIHQPEETGFVFEQNKIIPMTYDEKSQPTNEDALFAPISSTGETLGALVVEMDAAKQNTQTIELINTVARQVAQQVENLRLLDSAERYRAEAEQAARRQTLEAWKDYTDANATKGLSYLYDLNAVRPLDQGEGIQAEESALSQPLKVRDETVGKISVQGIKADDSESLDLVTTIAERLSAHIENLRLSEQTFDRARREQALRQITSAVRGSTDPSVILRTAARELGNLLGRKTVLRLAADAQTSRMPIDPVGQAIANNGNEPIPPAQSPNADGGKE